MTSIPENNFLCRVCNKIQDLSERHKGSQLTSQNKARCKSCHREYCKHRMSEKRAVISPHNYYECNDCDYIYHYKNGDICPRCKSLNTDDYLS